MLKKAVVYAPRPGGYMVEVICLLGATSAAAGGAHGVLRIVVGSGAEPRGIVAGSASKDGSRGFITLAAGEAVVDARLFFPLKQISNGLQGGSWARKGCARSLPPAPAQPSSQQPAPAPSAAPPSPQKPPPPPS